MTTTTPAPANAPGSTTVLSYEAAQGAAIAEEMRRDDSVFLMGQDIASGGFFGGTVASSKSSGLAGSGTPESPKRSWWARPPEQR